LQQTGRSPSGQLDGFLGCLVRTEQTVGRVAAAAVDRCGQDVVQTQYDRSACFFQDAFGAISGVDVAGQHLVGVVEDGLWIVGKNDFYLSAAFTNQLGVKFNIVYTGEWVQHLAEQLAVFCFGQHVAPWVDALFVEQLLVDKVVADLISREAEHQNDLFCAAGNALEADRKAVAAQDREDDTDGFSAKFVFDIGSDVIDVRIVSLCACNDRLGYSDNISVVEGKAFAFACCQDRIDDDFCKVVTFADDGRTNAAGYGTYQSFHNQNPLFFWINKVAVGLVLPRYFYYNRNIRISKINI